MTLDDLPLLSSLAELLFALPFRGPLNITLQKSAQCAKKIIGMNILGNRKHSLCNI